MAVFKYDNGHIYFADVGSGAPILLLHGLGNTGRAWARQIWFLQAAGYRVIIPDLPGHGASSPVTAAMSVDELGALMSNLLKFLALDSADVVGVSLGGMVALEMALRWPRFVNRLAVCNTFATFSTNARVGMVAEWQRQLVNDGGCVKRFEQSWPQLVSDEYAATASGLRTYLAWHAQAATASHESLVAICEGMKRYDARATLPSVSKDTLVMTGELDTIAPPSEGEYIASVVPNATHVSLEGSRHLSNVDRAKAFNWTLLRFLGTERRTGLAPNDVNFPYQP